MPVTFFTATAQVSPSGVPRVWLVVNWTSPFPSAVSLVRVEPGGRFPVRGAYSVPLDQTGYREAYDYEAPFDVPVSYEVVNTSTSEVGGSTTGTVTLASGDVPWLMHPGMPELSMPLDTVTTWPSWTRPVPSASFTVLGRAAPIVATGRRQAPAGTLGLFTQSSVEAQRLERLTEDGSVLLLKGAGGTNVGNQWVAVGDIGEAAYPRSNVRALVAWTLPLQVVDPPVLRAPAAVTYADVSARFASYADTRAAAFTYRDRTGGAWRTT